MLSSKTIFLIRRTEFLTSTIFSETNYESIKIPSGASVGDRIIIEGFNNTIADVGQLNPKKKVWDKIKADLKTNSDGEVVWREFSMITTSGDRIVSSLQNSNVE